MQVIVKSGAIEHYQMNKNVGKPAAIAHMHEMYKSEDFKSKDPWCRSRVNAFEAAKNAKNWKNNLDKIMPETLSSATKDRMWRRAKEIKDQFMVGMLSKEESHPTKNFTNKDGVIVHVVDNERMASLNSVERERAWLKRNESNIREFKSIMRHLCPENPNAGDIEKFRPRFRGMR